jgi:hypothetical protein
MDAREAVRSAKRYIQDIYSDENPANIGLEEVEFDGHSWHVTIGFSRPWELEGGILNPFVKLEPKRSYKLVAISDEDGKILSVKNREINRGS